MPKNISKKTLLQKGVIIFFIGFLTLMIFVFLGIGGLLRELARLTVIVGIIMIIVGFFKKDKK